MLLRPNQQTNQPQILKQMPFTPTTFMQLQHGALLLAKYSFWKNDPNPLVLITDILPDKIRGVNLHYLTLPYVKRVLSQYCGQVGFSYQSIKADVFLSNAFRSYKKAGLQSMQILDCETIKAQLNIARSFSPQEMQALKQQLQQQLRQRANPTAAELVGRPINNQNNSMGQVRQPNFATTLPSQPATLPATLGGPPNPTNQ